VTTVDGDDYAGNFALQDNGVGALASPRLAAELPRGPWRREGLLGVRRESHDLQAPGGFSLFL
jgi:hypothetical protein